MPVDLNIARHLLPASPACPACRRTSASSRSSAASSSTRGSTPSSAATRRTVYIGSADLMPRNLDTRVELLDADPRRGAARRPARHARPLLRRRRNAWTLLRDLTRRPSVQARQRARADASRPAARRPASIRASRRRRSSSTRGSTLRRVTTTVNIGSPDLMHAHRDTRASWTPVGRIPARPERGPRSRNVQRELMRGARRRWRPKRRRAPQRERDVQRRGSEPSANPPLGVRRAGARTWRRLSRRRRATRRWPARRAGGAARGPRRSARGAA